MIYTHVLNRKDINVVSPMDALDETTVAQVPHTSSAGQPEMSHEIYVSVTSSNVSN